MLIAIHGIISNLQNETSENLPNLFSKHLKSPRGCDLNEETSDSCLNGHYLEKSCNEGVLTHRTTSSSRIQGLLGSILTGMSSVPHPL